VAVPVLACVVEEDAIVTVLVRLVVRTHVDGLLVVYDVGCTVVHMVPLVVFELQAGPLNVTSVRDTAAPVACKPALSREDAKLEPSSVAKAMSAVLKLDDWSCSRIWFATAPLPRHRSRKAT